MKLDCIRPVGVGQQGRALALGLPSPTGSRGVNVGVSPESRRQQPRSSLGPGQEACGERRGSEGLN